MSKKEKEGETKSAEDLMQERQDELDKDKEQDKNPLPLGEFNKELNPMSDLGDDIREKDASELTEQEKVVLAEDELNDYQRAATTGAASSGSGPTDVAAGLSTFDGSGKEVIPPSSANLVDGDEDEDQEDEAEEVPFEPENDPKARLHGTHDAAMYGLQTDISGTYVPPGLVRSADQQDAESGERARLEKAQRDQQDLAYDNGLRRQGRF